MIDGGAPPVSLDEAVACLLALPRPNRPAETIGLAQAAGRVLATPVTARWPLPRFSASAVDGWAIAARDLAPTGETRLPIRGRIAAGEDAAGRAVEGGALRIFTGAMMPPGADTVVMQEDARANGTMVCLPPGVRPRAHVRLCGEQAAAGAVLVPAGRRLRPADLALAAAGGASHLAVQPRLRVGVLGSGDEVRPIGETLGPGAVPDQNGPMLAALVERCGGHLVASGLARDDPHALAARLVAMAASCDLVITTGGVSVGEEDHLRAALTTIGRLLFWRVALKPGRPAAAGSIGAVPVLALPGNPAAALTVFHLLGHPLLRHLSGESAGPDRAVPARAGFALRKAHDITAALPVTLALRDGEFWADEARPGQRGSLAALAEADALAIIGPDHCTLTPGEAVMAVPLDRFA